ncbi:MAG: LUD domain-containing protein [Deltaproteobacteria bacterium]|nr:LUD domain-containing protein [Deltaproteobacteria bacterium]
MRNEELIRIFMENASKVAAKPIRVEGSNKLNDILDEILANETSVYCPAKTELEKSVIIDVERRVEALENATSSVEEVVAGIAETGSIVVSSANGRALQTSLLPTYHVALLSADNIFASLDEFFKIMGNDLPTNVTFITGPSRTADIELTLTIGVHGPEKVSILVI